MRPADLIVNAACVGRLMRALWQGLCLRGRANNVPASLRAVTFKPRHYPSRRR